MTFKEDVSASAFKCDVARLIEDMFLQLNFRKLPTNIYPDIIDAMEKPLIECVLRACRGNQVRAAEVIGINRNTLRKKMAHHNLLPIDYFVDGTKRYGYNSRITY